jgi:VWFA-related protein
MNRLLRRGPLLALGLLLVWTPALAQDLSQRKGLRIKITNPISGEALLDEITIRAEVIVRQEADIDRVDFFLDDELLFSDAEPPWQVVHDFGDKAEPHVIKAIAIHRQGIQVSDFVVSRALDYADVVNVQRVLVNVAVRRSDGSLADDLGPDDFVLEEDGTAQQLLTVSRESRPITVALVVDSSGSMREEIDQLKQAACQFAQRLEPQDRGLVIDFDELITLRQPATADRELLCKSIREITPVGGTAVFDAIHATLRTLRRLAPERSAMVLLSDGDDTNSRAEFKQVLTELERDDVTLYAIGLGVGGFGGQLEGLARATGGRAFLVDKAEELAATYDQIARELRTLYQLTYSSKNTRQDGAFRRIRISVDRDGKFKLSHRTGYYAASEAQ